MLLDVTSQTIILGAPNTYGNGISFTQFPNVRVGLQAIETIVTPEDDSSLYSNASGTPNYTAPVLLK